MKRIKGLFCFLILMISLILIMINIPTKKQEMIYFELRYNFKTNINISWPEKLKRDDYSKYFLKFKLIGSDISYFDSFKLNQSNKIKLIIKSKYVFKIKLSELKTEDLLILGITSEQATSINDILHKKETQKTMKEEIKDVIPDDEEIFAKGIKRMVIFGQ